MMKKKFLLGAFAICLIFALVSCDDASFDKLASLMGGMGNNVYGITPSMEDVAEVSSTIDNSVGTEEAEDGTTSIKIDLSKAESIVSTLSEIATSTQKLNQAKENMKVALEVVTADGTKVESTEIQSALKSELGNVKNVLPDTTNITNDKVKDVVNQVSSALTTIIDKIPEEPTQADLATVVIIKSLADQASKLATDEEVWNKTEDVLPIVDTALAALDALKVTTEVSDIDVLGEFNITSLLGSSKKDETETGKATTGNEEDWVKYVNQLQENLIKLISLFSEKNASGYYEFNGQKYNRLILQMTALRTSYEIASLGLMPSISADKITEEIVEALRDGDSVDIFGDITDVINDTIESIKDKKKFSSNDLTLYLLSFIFTEADKVYAIDDNKENDNLVNILSKFLNNTTNEENLKKDKIEELDFDAFSFGDIELDLDKNEDIGTITSLLQDSMGLVRTVFVITVDSGSSDIFLTLATGGQGIGSKNTIGEYLSGEISEGLRNLIDQVSKGE